MAHDSDRGCLPRAGWHIISPEGFEEASSYLTPDLEAEGERLVTEIASSWGGKYLHTIKPYGPHEGAFHYQCIFSAPTPEVPVPVAVVSTFFALVVPAAVDDPAGNGPRMLFSFEEGDLRHEWKLTRDRRGNLQMVEGQQAHSLRDGIFEQYLDAYIHDKDTAIATGIKVTTSFEETRLQPPPAYDEDPTIRDGSDAEDDSAADLLEDSALMESQFSSELADPEEMQVLQSTLVYAGVACDKVRPPATLTELLANIFDAADEDNRGELAHYEVAKLLGATLPGYGLEQWDIHVLLSTAQETNTGLLEWASFVQAAPEFIQELRKRRLAYRERGFPGVDDISEEGIKFCFFDELTKTGEKLMEIFEARAAEDPSVALWHYVQPIKARKTGSVSFQLTGDDELAMRSSISAMDPAELANITGKPQTLLEPTGAEGEEKVLAGLRRGAFGECLEQLPQRMSPQEAKQLMQMMIEDEDGTILIEENFIESLEALRSGAIMNALVATELSALRKQLVLRFRALDIPENSKVKVWLLKNILLTADQVCLSRLQIHTLLCLAAPDPDGNVDISQFLGMCCSVLPHMQSASIFNETSEQLIADQHARERQAETAALEASLERGRGGGEEEAEGKEEEISPEDVDKALLQVLQLADDSHGRQPATLAPEAMYHALNSGDAQVQQCQLTEKELVGFVAEMQLDANGEVAYHDHVKRWVPVLFELRKHPFYGFYLHEDMRESLGLQDPDPQEMEELFPLYPVDPVKMVQRRGGMRTNNSRRSTLERRESRMLRRESKTMSSIASESGSLRQAESDLATRLQARLSKGSVSRGASKDMIVGHADNPPGRGHERRNILLASVTEAAAADSPA